MNLSHRSHGFAYLIIIVFATMLFIFMFMITSFRSGAVSLMNKSERDFFSTTLGETAVNCVLSELRLDNGFCTHQLYKPKDEDPWDRPTKKKASNIAPFNSSPVHLTISGIESGVYKGETQGGKFKLKLAKVFGQNDAKTSTLRENQMYLRAEAVTFVGDGKKPDEDSYRRLTVWIARRNPAAEYLLYDGEMLDMGLGPFEAAMNQVRRGRLYGYQYITLPMVGSKDRGSDLFEMEKIETPGQIRALKEASVEFSDKKSTRLNSTNDSGTSYAKFNSYNGYLLDGAHGAHPIKMHRLPKEYFYEKAKKSSLGGFIIEKTTFPVSKAKYKNPYNLNNDFFDLDFGGYFCGETAPDDGGSGSGGGDDDEDSSDPPYGTDDPEGIKTTRGKKLFIYSKVPIRIWGCPDRTITIYCERDIVIGGDFNQNIEAPQDYPDTTYQTYKTAVRNGKGGSKVGAIIMSEGRIFIDVSRPCHFLKNEVKPFFLYELAMRLGPNDFDFPNIKADTRKDLCPQNPKDRKGIVGESQPNSASGTAIPIFGVIAWLKNHPQITSGPAYDSQIAGIVSLLSPGADGQVHLGIKDAAKRQEIIAEIDKCCRKEHGGVLTREDLDRIYEMVWTQVATEEDAAPDPTSGAMGIANFLFDEAQKFSNDGISVPEITVNAALISSTRRSGAWKIGSVNQGDTIAKAFDEIGNAPVGENGIFEYLKKPKFLIQRIYGSEIRLASMEPAYFITGKFGCTNILRRRIWDKTLGGGDYQPKGMPMAFGILTYRDETITKKEYDKF